MLNALSGLSERFNADNKTENAFSAFNDWLMWFENFLAVNKLPALPATAEGSEAREIERKQMLITYMGPKTMHAYGRLKADDDTFDRIVGKLRSYYKPHANAFLKTSAFRRAKQNPGESIDRFVDRLEGLAEGCDFQDLNKEILQAMIESCHSSDLRRQMSLIPPDRLTLSYALDLARSFEAVEKSIHEEHAYRIEQRGAEQQPVSIRYQNPNSVLRRDNRYAQNESFARNEPYRQHSEMSENRFGRQNSEMNENRFGRQNSEMNENRFGQRRVQFSECNKCGRLHDRGTCPARGNSCNKCGKLNHFARMCRTQATQSQNLNQPYQSGLPDWRRNARNQTQQQANYILQEQEQRDYHILAVNAVRGPEANVRVCGKEFVFKIDTGSNLNLMSECEYARLSTKPVLQQARINVFGYMSKKPLELLGKFETSLMCERTNRNVNAIVHVIRGYGVNLLSCQTSTELGLVSLLNSVSTTAESNSLQESLKREIPEVFEDRVGKIKDFQLRLHVDESVRPTVRKHVRIPFHLRQAVDVQLEKLLADDVIEPATGYTPWVVPAVVVPKANGQIRICADGREPNKAILRERHIAPTFEDVAYRVNGSKFFSKIDLNQGYHQVEIHPDSRYMLVFSTHRGLFRYKRLNFGVCCASEMFQNAISQILIDVPDQINISDDILVFGKTKQEHDDSVKRVIRRLAERGCTINAKKSEFGKSDLIFFGMRISGEGVSLNEEKVKALKEAEKPKTAKGIKSFLGLAAYCSSYIPRFAELAKPLRALTKKNAVFYWNTEAEEAFNKIKASLTNCVLAYFKPDWNAELVVDASPTGLCALLAQRDPKNSDSAQIVAYASRMLSEDEMKYSQLEKEALACVWGCEKFHLYLYACKFKLVTDNAPVQMILKNSCSRKSARIQRWALRLNQYDFEIAHRPGESNPADYLSRHTKLVEANVTDEADKFVNFVEYASLPKAITLPEMIEATEQDGVLQQLKDAIRTGSFNKDTLVYKKFSGELSVSSNGLILKGQQIVIPYSLESRILQIAHEGHLGIVKTKQIIRDKVWFPGMGEKVESLIGNCLACQAQIESNVRVNPLMMNVMPSEPWKVVQIDHYSRPDGGHDIVVVDAGSRMPFVEEVASTSAEANMPVLDTLFSTFGVPEVVRTDNGPPFNSERFAQFAKYMGFKHQKITPEHPEANGLVERFMPNLTKIYTAAIIEKKPRKQALNEFLRNYRSTPHTSTGYAPADLFFAFQSNASRIARLAHIGQNNLAIARPSVEHVQSEKPNPVDHRIGQGGFRPHDELASHVKSNKINEKYEKARERDAKAKKRMKVYADERRKATEPDIQINDWVLIKQRRTHKRTPAFEPAPYKVVAVNGSMVTGQRQGDGRLKTRDVAMCKRVSERLTEQAVNIKAQHQWPRVIWMRQPVDSPTICARVERHSMQGPQPEVPVVPDAQPEASATPVAQPAASAASAEQLAGTSLQTEELNTNESASESMDSESLDEFANEPDDEQASAIRRSSRVRKTPERLVVNPKKKSYTA